MGKNFLLFIDALKVNHAKFYNFVLLHSEFIKMGHNLDIMIPPVIDPSAKNPDRSPYIFDLTEIKEYYDIDILPCKKELLITKKYDAVLIVEFTLLEKNDKFALTRQKVVNIYKGPIICLKTDTIFEYYRVDNPKVKYGVLTTSPIVFNREYPGYKNEVSNKNLFQMPLLCNPSYGKPNALSRDEFCAKHGLDPKKKIVAYLPGFFKKMWEKGGTIDYFKKTKNPSARETLVNFFLLNENFHHLISAFDSHGYQLVGKLHVRNPDKFFRVQKNDKFVHFKKIKYVDQYYYFELLKYADFAITIGTTMVYYLYLCNLPAMDFGSGNYFPSWSSVKNKNLDKGANPDPFKKYGSGKDLILGKTYSLQSFPKLTPKIWTKILIDFLKIDHKKNFKHFKNNPLYGKSYQATLGRIVNLILEQAS